MKEYLPLVISFIALCVAIYNLWQIKKKNRLDKSIIRAEIVSIVPHTETGMYPSMEDKDSKYCIRIGVMNSGYKKELIQKIKLYFRDKTSEHAINKTIGEKSNIIHELVLKRFEVINLTKIELLPMEDKKIKILKSELKSNQRNVELHVKKLEKEWKDGKRSKEE